MPARRFTLFRIVLTATAAAALIALAAIQLASDALNSGAAAPATLPRRIPPKFGLAVYRLLDRIAPAAYVEATLAQQALEHGDADGAERYAVRLPASPVRDELLARVAGLRGQSTLAAEYLLAAPDPVAFNTATQRRAVQDPAAGYALERLLRDRLARSGTHPDAVAEASWQMGLLANREAWRQIPGSPAQHGWLQRADDDFGTAARLAPLSERYVVAAANQADLLNDRVRAQRLFAHAGEIDPGSADAVAGLGVVAWQNGDRRGAAEYLRRARAIDPDALMVRALERDLR